MTTPNLPKKHHYIPQFYLKGFSQDKNNLYVYDKQVANPKDIKKLTTKAIAFENNFYTYESIDRTKETMEDLFGQMEGIAAEVIRKITDGQKIDNQERADLAVFISFLYFRTPTSKKEMNNLTATIFEHLSRREISMIPNQKLREIWGEEGKGVTDEEIEDFRAFTLDKERSEFSFDVPQNYWIKEMLHLGMKISYIFQSLDWEIAVANRTYAYITSDNPFMLIPSRPTPPLLGLGLLTPGAKKVIPLNSKVCLIMHEPKENPQAIIREVSKDDYRMVNEFTYEFASRFVFSADEGKLAKMAKTIKLKPMDKTIIFS